MSMRECYFCKNEREVFALDRIKRKLVPICQECYFAININKDLEHIH